MNRHFEVPIVCSSKFSRFSSLDISLIICIINTLFYKNKSMRTALFLICLLVGIASCNREPNSSLLQKTDGVTIKIDSLLNDLHAIPIQHTDSLKLELLRRMSLLKDSLSAYDTHLSYLELEKRLDSTNKILDWYYLMQNELSFSKGHLHTLKTDYLDGAIADSTFQKKIVEEELIINNIREKLDSGLQNLGF